MSGWRARYWFGLVLSVLTILVIPKEPDAAERIGFYASPSIGFARYRFKGLEIEESFVKKTEETENIDTSGGVPDIEEESVVSVGRKANYDGSGVTIGIGAGIRLFSLSLGVHYDWTPVNVEGYWKDYQYIAELERASGAKVKETGKIHVQRVLFELIYGLPIWRFELGFRSRVGAVFIDNNGLPMGRAAEQGSGFAGELGLCIEYYITGYLTVGLDGFYGILFFYGDYEGVYGTGGGLDAFFTLRF